MDGLFSISFRVSLHPDLLCFRVDRSRSRSATSAPIFRRASCLCRRPDTRPSRSGPQEVVHVADLAVGGVKMKALQPARLVQHMSLQLQLSCNDTAIASRQRSHRFSPSGHATLPTMAATPALTSLSEDERLVRDSVYEFADREIRPLVREMDEQAKMPPRAHRQAVRARPHGHRDPRSARRRRRQLLPCRPGGRGAVAGRPLGRRAGRRAEHAGHQRAAALGQRRDEAALPAAARGVGRRRLRAVRGRLGQRRVRAGDARRSSDGDGDWVAHRPQALDHQRARGRPLHRLRHRRPRRRLQRHHRVPRRARLAGLHGRQEGRQARHPRQQHLRADPRGLPRAGARTCSARSARATRSRSRR